MTGKTITIQLSEANATHLERFLQGIMPTHKFQPPNGGLEMDACNDLYNKLRQALDALDSKSN